jgi:hypothetical protein
MKLAALDCTASTSLGETKEQVMGAARILDPTGAPRTTQHLRHPLFVMQHVKAVTSYAAAYTHRWWCEPDCEKQHFILAKAARSRTRRSGTRRG